MGGDDPGGIYEPLLFAGPTCATAADCNDGSLCTTDTCGTSGCSYVAVSCSDGNACTTDTCAATTGCSPLPDVGVRLLPGTSLNR